jgi:hypothetical protein
MNRINDSNGSITEGRRGPEMESKEMAQGNSLAKRVI